MHSIVYTTHTVSGVAMVGPVRAQALPTGELFYAHARDCVSSDSLADHILTLHEVDINLPHLTTETLLAHLVERNVLFTYRFRNILTHFNPIYISLFFFMCSL